MRTHIFKYSLVVLISIFLFARPVFTDDEEEDGEDGDRPRSCYKYTYDFTIDSLTTALKCVANLKPKSIFEYATRSWCILKCVFQEFGTLDENGYLDDIAAAFFFEETFHPEVQAVLLPKVQECFAYASEFNPKEYWCKSYAKFAECTLIAVVQSQIPFSINCFATPVLSTALSALKFIAPDSPPAQELQEELKRQYQKQLLAPKCFNKNCTTKYKVEKHRNGTSSLVLFDRNMTEISRTLKPKKSKSKTTSGRSQSQLIYNSS